MRVRATIMIDIDAADFVEAAEHQRQIEAYLAELQQTYGAAVLDFRERRTSRREQAQPSGPSRQIRSATGRLKTYVD